MNHLFSQMTALEKQFVEGLKKSETGYLSYLPHVVLRTPSGCRS